MTSRAVAIVITDGVHARDVTGPLDVFAEANGFLAVEARYEVVVLAPAAPAVRASNGMAIVADRAVADAPIAFDTALVAGGAAADERLAGWLRAWGAQATRYGSIGAGAFALGRAGLLDGRRATVDRPDAGRLAAMFPAARVTPDQPVLRDGALVTAAGATAGTDLALALVADDHGPAIADALRRQHGRCPAAAYPDGPDTPLHRVLTHVRAHLDEPLPVDRLALVAGTSPRSLARLFTAGLDTTPRAFVESCRVDLARSLLESSSAGLKVLAHRCGFGGAEQMRVVFQRRLGISPAAYRRSRSGPRPGSERAQDHRRDGRLAGDIPLVCG